MTKSQKAENEVGLEDEEARYYVVVGSFISTDGSFVHFRTKRLVLSVGRVAVVMVFVTKVDVVDKFQGGV